MAINTFIKDLFRYPEGSASTVPSSHVVEYINTSNYVAIDSDVVNNDDGTGLNQLRKYRLQFDDPTFDTRSTTSLSELNNFYLSYIPNTTLTGSKPYSFNQFRGGAAFYLHLINGLPEPAATRVKNFVCKLSKPSGWWKCIKCKYLKIFTILLWAVQVLLIIVFPTAGLATNASNLLGFGHMSQSAQIAFTTATSAGGYAHTARSDKKGCYKYVHNFTGALRIGVAGGYGLTGRFKVWMTTGRGAAVPCTTSGGKSGTSVIVDSGEILTWQNLQASQSRDSIGLYNLRVQDIITGQTLRCEVSIPYHPVSTFLGIKRDKPTIKIVSALVGGPTGTASIDAFALPISKDTVIWMDPTAITSPGAPSGVLEGIDDPPVDSAGEPIPGLDDCLTYAATVRGKVYDFNSSVDYLFSYKKNNSTTYTPIGTWKTIPAASLAENPVIVEERLTTTKDDTGGVIRMQIRKSSTPTSIVTIDGTQSIGFTSTFDIITTTEPLRFIIDPPEVDFTNDNIFDINITSVKTRPTVPTDDNRNYTVTLTYDVSSCKGFGVSALCWNGDISTTFNSNTSFPPPAGFITPVQSKAFVGTGAAGGVYTGQTFSYTFNDIDPAVAPTIQKTFLLIAHCNTTVWGTLRFPEAYYKPEETVDGDVIPEIKSYKVTRLA